MNDSNKKLLRTLGISILLHLLITGLVWIRPSNPLDLSRKQPIELEFLETDKALEKMLEAQKHIPRPDGQIVEQDRTVNDETPEKSKYLGQFNQKVEKETRAEKSGTYRNTMGGPQSKPAEPSKEVPEKQQAKDESSEQDKEEIVEKPVDKLALKFQTRPDGDVETGSEHRPRLKDLKPKFKLGPTPPTDSLQANGGQGPSATDDHLKDVNTGLQTLLNTREFVYYSYYNRIKDKLRQYWEPKIREKMTRILQQGRTIASSSDRITKIVIILNSEGTLVGVQVVSGSGVQDLDEAAIEAFRAAAPFPNPPKGIVESDGLIRIRWDFILEAGNGTSFNFRRVAQKR